MLTLFVKLVLSSNNPIASFNNILILDLKGILEECNEQLNAIPYFIDTAILIVDILSYSRLQQTLYFIINI